MQMVHLMSNTKSILPLKTLQPQDHIFCSLHSQPLLINSTVPTSGLLSSSSCASALVSIQYLDSLITTFKCPKMLSQFSRPRWEKRFKFWSSPSSHSSGVWCSLSRVEHKTSTCLMATPDTSSFCSLSSPKPFSSHGSSVWTCCHNWSTGTPENSFQSSMSLSSESSAHCSSYSSLLLESSTSSLILVEESTVTRPKLARKKFLITMLNMIESITRTKPLLRKIQTPLRQIYQTNYLMENTTPKEFYGVQEWSGCSHLLS